MKAIPFSRRQFLRTLGPAGALLLRPPCLRAAPRSDISFVIVTDTHLGYKDQEKAERNWLQMAAQIDAEPGAFVLHLGDIVDGGREAEFPKYLAGRQLIHKPVHEIPGNHDPQEPFQRHIREKVDTAIEHEWLRVLLIGNAHTDSHDGFIEASQITWLGEQCDQAVRKDQLVIIAMHVPVHENRHPDRGWYVKPANGQTEFYALLQKHAGRILAVFHGHFHNGIRGWDDHTPVHEVCFPSALYNLDRQLEEKGAPGYNPVEFRAGFTRVAIRAGAMVLEFQPSGVKEVLKKELPLRGA